MNAARAPPSSGDERGWTWAGMLALGLVSMLLVGTLLLVTASFDLPALSASSASMR